jgi:hypothetical protein
MERAPCHNSRQTTAEIEKLGPSKIPPPSYSPHSSPCVFSLFVFLKENAKGIEHGSGQDGLNVVWAILGEIQRSNLVATYEDGIESLKDVIEIGKEYLNR